MKLEDIMPELAREFEAGLREIGEVKLANTVSGLEITGRCECGDNNCGTFYTQDKEVWSGKKLRQAVPTVKGLYAVDVFENEVVCIEILDREDVSEKLNQLFQIRT